jgi:hypothetical protein
VAEVVTMAEKEVKMKGVRMGKGELPSGQGPRGVRWTKHQVSPRPL